MAVAPLQAQAPGAEAGPTPVTRLGEQVFDAVAEIGDVARFSVLTLVWIFRKRSRWSVLVPIFYAIGVKSVSVVAITGWAR
jgi:phospholipid/cholesterol/gamma-HCH transport system permease protein